MRACKRLLTGVLLTAALALATGPVTAGIMDDLRTQLDGPREPLFPEPLEMALRKIDAPEDRLVWSFRELSRCRQLAAEGSSLHKMMIEAHDQYHRALCWDFTKKLRRHLAEGKPEAMERLLAALAEPSLPEDAAAFEPVLSRLEGQEDAAREAAARLTSLAAPEALAAYVHATDADTAFFKKARAWTRLGRRVKKGWRAAVDKVARRFTPENMIRFLERLRRNPKTGDRLKGRVDEAASRLRDELVPSILDELDDRIEGGLTLRVQSFAKVGGFIQQKSALLSGKLRRLVKFVQTLEGSRDLSLFLPSLTEVQRGIKARLSRGELGEEARTYLAKVETTLGNCRVVLRLRARKSSPPRPEASLWKAMWEAMKAEGLEDELGKLGELPALD